MKTRFQKYKEIFHRADAWLILLTVSVLIVPNLLLCATEHLSIWASFANVLIPAGVYLFLLGCFRNVGRTVVILFPFMFLGAFQIVLLALYGRSVIAVDMFLNVATTNSGEVGELLGNLLPTIGFVCALYLPPLIFGIITSLRKRRQNSLEMRAGKGAGLTLAGLGIGAAAVALGTGTYSFHNDLFPANAINNLATAITRENKIKKYEETSRDFAYGSQSELSDTTRQLYVLVVGETSRAGSWQLAGYDRETNPKLAKRKENIVMFDHAMSESNTTHKSVPLMLSPLTSSDYEKNIYYVKGIISAFKEAGFSTAYVSNQERNHGFIDFFGEEADRCIFIKDDPDKYESAENDLVMNGLIDEIISEKAARQLIVVHTYGSHFNYRSRYDDEFRKFTPDEVETPEASRRKELVNAYDNTILMTDAFLDGVIASMEKREEAQSVLLYAADHGEDIFDDARGLFLHASPCPSYYQLHVPMLAWTSDRYAEAHPEKVMEMHRRRHDPVSTSTSYFHTALDLACISTKYYDSSRSVASKSYKTRPLAYLNDHNEGVGLEKAGFGPMDFRLMERNRITASK